MQIYGIGVDIVDTERITRSIEEYGEKFLDRVFTESEQEYCGRMKFAERHYAARFSAKEAVAKAFGIGIGGELAWRDMEIFRNELGKPYLVLSGHGKIFADSHGITEVMISISHADHHAAANAVAICGDA